MGELTQDQLTKIGQLVSKETSMRGRSALADAAWVTSGNTQARLHRAILNSFFKDIGHRIRQ